MTANLTLIVCGGRDYNDADLVKRVLDCVDRANGIDTVVHGGATGADDLAREWAEQRRKHIRCFAADWRTHGRKAGPIRNQQMLNQAKPDGVIAFPGGRGTADMVRRAEAAGVAVMDLRDRG